MDVMSNKVILEKELVPHRLVFGIQNLINVAVPVKGEHMRKISNTREDN